MQWMLCMRFLSIMSLGATICFLYTYIYICSYIYSYIYIIFYRHTSRFLLNLMCFAINYFILPLCLFGGYPSNQTLKFKTFQSLQHETHAQSVSCFLAITLCLLFPTIPPLYMYGTLNGTHCNYYEIFTMY